MQHAMVFYAGGDDVVSCFRKSGSRAVYCGVVRFGATAGENHPTGPASQHSGYFFSSIVQSMSSFLAHGVNTGRITVKFSEIGKHRLQDSWVHGRGAGVVQVDGA
jgi:hypothetical protein